MKVLQLSDDTVGTLQEVVVMASGDAAGGDLTGTYPNPTLANSGVTSGTYGYPSSVVVDAKGRITSITAGSAPSGATNVVTATNSSGSTIPANSAVNLYNSGSTLTMRLADSGTTNNYPVHGFTTAAVTNSSTGTVQVNGILSGFSFVAADTGSRIYSDATTPGGVTKTATNTASTKLQLLGYCLGAGVVNIDIAQPIIQA